MATQDHNDTWGLLSSVMIEVEDYLDTLEAGMESLDELRGKEGAFRPRLLHSSRETAMEGLHVLTHRHICYLRLVCGVRNGS